MGEAGGGESCSVNGENVCVGACVHQADLGSFAVFFVLLCAHWK